MAPLPPPPSAADDVKDVRPDTKERVLGGIGGFLSGATGQDFSGTPLDQMIEQHHQKRLDEARMYRRNAATFAGILATGHNPDTGAPLTDEERRQYQNQYDASWAQYEKSAGVSKDVKQHLATHKQLLDRVISQGTGGAGNAGGQPATSGASGGLPMADDTATPSASSARPSAPPTPPASSASPAAPPAAASTLPPPPTLDSQMQADAPRLAQRLTAQSEFSDFQRKQDLLHQHKMEEAAALQKAKAQSGPQPRPVHAGSISVLDARRLSAQGQVFMGENGEPIDLGQFDDSMGLYGMTTRGPDGQWRVTYTPFSPNQRTVTVGNETFAVSPMDISKVTSGAGEDLGQHTTPRTGTHEIVTVGPGGKVQTDRLTTTSTPSTPGARGRGARSQGQGTATTPSARPIAPPKAGTGSTGGAAKTGASGHPSGVPIAQYNTYLSQVRPARMAATQLFGDPNNPKFQSLSSFGDLVGNADAQARVATAWNLIREHMDEAGADPSHSGDLVTLMRNYAGTPGAVAQSEAVKMEDALRALRPREAEMLNRLFSTYGTVIGLRALTKGSSAKFSARNMEQEVPIPGMNVKTPRAFYDKLATLAEEVNTGFKGIPDQVMEPGERAFDQSQQQHLEEMARRGSSTRPTPPPSRTGAPRTAEDLEREMMKGK